MANVQDVARFLIDLSQGQNEAGIGDLMTNLRLQKLLYFAQGYHLARYGTPLFAAPIQAWKLGPVVPEVYNQYKAFGGQGIVTYQANQNGLTEKEYEILLDVVRDYDAFSTSELVRQSHVDGGPWSCTTLSEEIPVGTIKNYFATLPTLLSVDDLLDRLPVEGV